MVIKGHEELVLGWVGIECEEIEVQERKVGNHGSKSIGNIGMEAT